MRQLFLHLFVNVPVSIPSPTLSPGCLTYVLSWDFIPVKTFPQSCTQRDKVIYTVASHIPGHSDLSTKLSKFVCLLLQM